MWQRARNVRLLVMDVDGVLTDGRLLVGPQGQEWKAFHVHDGQGIALAQRAGLRTAWMSGRDSEAVRQRAAELGVSLVYQGVTDKVAVLTRLLAEVDLPAVAAAYMGDDLPDIPVFRCVGLPIAVASAPPEVRACAAWVTRAAGGAGAVREVIDLLLRAQGRWSTVVREYIGI